MKIIHKTYSKYLTFTQKCYTHIQTHTTKVEPGIYHCKCLWMPTMAKTHFFCNLKMTLVTSKTQGWTFLPQGKHLGYISPLIQTNKQIMFFICLFQCSLCLHLSTSNIFKRASCLRPLLLPEVHLINDFFTPSLLANNWRGNWFSCLNHTTYKWPRFIVSNVLPVLQKLYIWPKECWSHQSHSHISSHHQSTRLWTPILDCIPKFNCIPDAEPIKVYSAHDKKVVEQVVINS